MRDINKFRGCLIGGAVGDALGYAVEFKDAESIFEEYGPDGITEYDLTNGLALISDDTQMTLFTANGLLLAKTHGTTSYTDHIALCYKDWLKTQGTEDYGFDAPEHAWLNNIPAMNHPRAPGHTCLNYLMHDNLGTPEDPRNNSKGCGGVMRVAPVGLYFDKRHPLAEIDRLGAEAAALTHGHELGFIPAAMLAHIIHLLTYNAELSVLETVEQAKLSMTQLFPNAKHLAAMLDLTDKAIALAADPSMNDLEAIVQLGEGWVAEETLAIAIYCALKYENDFEKAIIASVNHSGDSDSTGAVTGNILGAHLGMKAIPKKFLTHLELKETILKIADDLCKDFDSSVEMLPTDVWARKYIYHTYPEDTN